MAVIERREGSRGLNGVASATTDTPWAVQLSDLVITHKEKLEQTVSTHPFVRGMMICAGVSVLFLSVWLMIGLKRSVYK